MRHLKLSLVKIFTKAKVSNKSLEIFFDCIDLICLYFFFTENTSNGRQFALWLFQSALWQSREQYCTILQFMHMALATFSHFAQFWFVITEKFTEAMQHLKDLTMDWKKNIFCEREMKSWGMCAKWKNHERNEKNEAGMVRGVTGSLIFCHRPTIL